MSFRICCTLVWTSSVECVFIRFDEVQVARSQDVRCMCLEPARSLLEPRKVAVMAPICASPLLVSAAQIQIDSVFCFSLATGILYLQAWQIKSSRKFTLPVPVFISDCQKFGKSLSHPTATPFPCRERTPGEPRVMVTGPLLFLYHFCSPFLIFPGLTAPYAGA